MTVPPPQSSPPPAAPVKALARAGRWQRLWALAFVAVGLVLLAANLRLLPPGLQRGLAWGWPVLLVAAGVWLLLAGRPRTDAAAPGFALERGEATTAELWLGPGLADARLGALAVGDHLALGHVPSTVAPAVTRADGQVRLRLAPPVLLGALSSGVWSLDLAPDLPWALRWQSSLGDAQLDLRELDLASADLRSALGHVDLTLPARGQAGLSVRLGLGNLTLRVPESMAVKVKVNRGRLATVQPDARRFVELAPGEWSTPLFAVSPARCTVNVYLWAGDLTLV